jgi:Family of unknown function (DUF6263)
MKIKTYLFLPLALVIIGACNNNKNEKKMESPPAKDSSSINVTPSSVEKQFDSVVTKQVRDSVLLKFNFRKGKVYDYVLNFDVNSEREGKKRNNTMKWNYNMEVVDEKKNIRTIKTTYKRIEMAMDLFGTGQKTEFSSEKEVDPMNFLEFPSKMFAALKGKSFMMQVNEKGEIISVSGLDKIGEALVSAVNLPDEMKQKMLQGFKGQFSEDAVKQMFSQSFNIFPNKFVSIGDSWQKRTASSAPIDLEATTTYTVKNIKNNLIYLTSNSKLRGDNNSTGTETGKLIVDAKTGLVTEASFEQKLNGKVQINSKSTIRGKEH